MDQSKQAKKQYDELVKKVSPNSNLFTNCIKAFCVGGLICTIGEGVIQYVQSMGFSEEDAALINSIMLILASSILTGLGLYGKFGKFSGAGTVVPITGFANSVVSPAIEFKKEGWIFGLGAKMFIIAGPVIVYGTLTSMVVGLVYYFLK